MSFWETEEEKTETKESPYKERSRDYCVVYTSPQVPGAPEAGKTEFTFSRSMAQRTHGLWASDL
jgi:hypothetical protein